MYISITLKSENRFNHSLWLTKPSLANSSMFIFNWRLKFSWSVLLWALKTWFLVDNKYPKVSSTNNLVAVVFWNSEIFNSPNFQMAVFGNLIRAIEQNWTTQYIEQSTNINFFLVQLKSCFLTFIFTNTEIMSLRIASPFHF